MSRELANKQIYTDEMAKGMDEKLFFFDHVDADIIIDFGCADGRVSKAVAKHGGYDVIGYDKNPDLFSEETSSVQFESDWGTVCKLAKKRKSVGVYLSSILHEIYSFDQSDDLIEKLNMLDYDYLIIRDMYMTDAEKKQIIEESDIMEVVDSVNLRLVNSFVCNHGPLMGKKHLIHFMMKHRFAYNWDYEIREDYLSITDDHIDYFKSLGDVLLEDHHPLPYYQDVFKGRYNYDLHTPTHIKLVIKV